jgi:hypothetical protein
MNWEVERPVPHDELHQGWLARIPQFTHCSLCPRIVGSAAHISLTVRVSNKLRNWTRIAVDGTIAALVNQCVDDEGTKNHFRRLWQMKKYES